MVTHIQTNLNQHISSACTTVPYYGVAEGHVESMSKSCFLVLSKRDKRVNQEILLM